ncbi:hypothetical protein INR79_08675 [Vibrio sp. SCSIO 43132]|uniref:immunity protein Tsi6 family protein n=1 Tax=Vibrio sp. SCSIO 43132 TaxID=2779363 RepID=UPI001CA83B3B|nr:immunity protein Tsi6 family protein [Vibrio sp. SCSIO 43132]UAB71950.1 hypothetical protein INR79_08675 [Vibrio sp. SCSIO 43132]
MSQEEIKIDICNHALEVLKDRRSVMLPQVTESIENQLQWLVSYFSSVSNDREKLFTLTFGHYAVREIDPREKQLVNALNAAYYVADRTRRGLKLDLKVLGLDS